MSSTPASLTFSKQPMNLNELQQWHKRNRTLGRKFRKQAESGHFLDEDGIEINYPYQLIDGTRMTFSKEKRCIVQNEVMASVIALEDMEVRANICRIKGGWMVEETPLFIDRPQKLRKVVARNVVDATYKYLLPLCS